MAEKPYTAKQVAADCGVSQVTLWKWQQAGILKAGDSDGFTAAERRQALELAAKRRELGRKVNLATAAEEMRKGRK